MGEVERLRFAPDGLVETAVERDGSAWADQGGGARCRLAEGHFDIADRSESRETRRDSGGGA